VRGMYFFGYGDFVAARGSVGVGITKHLSLHAGYQMGSRLSIHGTSDQIAIRLTQKGPTAGIEIFLGRSSGAEAAAVRSQIAGRLACRLDTLLSLVQRATRKCWGAGICRSRQRKLLRYYFAAQHSADEHTGRASQASRPGDRSGLHEPFVGRKIYAGRESLLRLHHKLQNVLRDPEAYFRLLERDRGSVDVVAGARFWHLDNSLAFLQGGTTAVSIGQTRSGAGREIAPQPQEGVVCQPEGRRRRTWGRLAADVADLQRDREGVQEKVFSADKLPVPGRGL